MSILQFYSILHLLAAVVWIGGMIFMNLILMPGLNALEPQQRGPVIAVAAKRFTVAVWVCFIILLITGGLKVPPGMMFAPESHYGEILMIKHIIILLALIIGLVISLSVAPKVIKLAPKPGEAATAEFLSAQKMLKTLSATNMILGIIIVIVISLR